MHPLWFVLTGVLLGAYAALGLLRPEQLPAALRSEEVGFALTYDVVYPRFDRALEAGQPDEALAWADELLWAVDGAGEFARDAEAMRVLALHRGAEGPETWRERGWSWRPARVLARRPTAELVAGLAGPLLFAIGLVALRRERAALRPPPTPWAGERSPLG